MAGQVNHKFKGIVIFPTLENEKSLRKRDGNLGNMEIGLGRLSQPSSQYNLHILENNILHEVSLCRESTMIYRETSKLFWKMSDLIDAIPASEIKFIN